MWLLGWQAVTEGRWLLVEDINLAPPEVLAALVPLLESRTLHLSQRAQVIRAAPGFQFMASCTTAAGAPLPPMAAQRLQQPSGCMPVPGLRHNTQ